MVERHSEFGGPITTFATSQDQKTTSFARTVSKQVPFNLMDELAKRPDLDLGGNGLGDWGRY